MDQKEKTKLIWFSILTITLGSIASFLLYFAGWVASITSFITMFVLILIYKKFCKSVPNKKTLIYEIVAVNLSHIVAIVISMFVTTAIYNNISVGDAFGLISSSLVSYLILLIITISLTVAMSLFGSLSAYQYYNNVFKTCEIIAAPTQGDEQAKQEPTEKTE